MQLSMDFNQNMPLGQIVSNALLDSIQCFVGRHPIKTLDNVRPYENAYIF